MKNLIIAIAPCLLLFASCKEKAPAINFGQAVTKDTTFILSPAPAAELHNVLVEEFTGQSCSNCPAAHVTLNTVEEAHEKGRVNVIGLYFEGITQTIPPAGAKYDFRHAHSKMVTNEVYLGVNAIPAGGIDRMMISGSRKIDRSIWSSTIENRLTATSAINLKVESEYSTADSMASIRVTMVYNKAIAFPHNLTIAIVEDSIIDIQDYPSTDPVHPGKDDNYVFTNVFRGMVTAAPGGDAVLTSLPAKEPGRAIVKNYHYKVANVLNPAKCRVIVFVGSADGTNLEILQSAQVKLK